MKSYKIFTILVLIVLVSFGTIGGCGSEDSGPEFIERVSGEIEYFIRGFPPELPIFSVSCAFFYADNGITYSIVGFPEKYNLDNAKYFTFDLSASDDGDELCGGGLVAIIENIHEKKCSNTNIIEDICPIATVESYCCPEGGGCVTDFADCSTNVCGEGNKPCGLFCIDEEVTCTEPPFCEANEKKCDGHCIPEESTCCENYKGDFIEVCGSEYPICCPSGDCTSDSNLCLDIPICSVNSPQPCGPDCIGENDACCFCESENCNLDPRCKNEDVPPTIFPEKPILIQPNENQLIKQNNPLNGCTLASGGFENLGFGHIIYFDWSDSESPNGISGYNLYASYPGAVPIINEFVVESEFTYISCNSVPNNLTGWEWYVQAVDGEGNLGEKSVIGIINYEPCIRENGEQCGTN